MCSVMRILIQEDRDRHPLQPQTAVYGSEGFWTLNPSGRRLVGIPCQRECRFGMP